MRNVAVLYTVEDSDGRRLIIPRLTVEKAMWVFTSAFARTKATQLSLSETWKELAERLDLYIKPVDDPTDQMIERARKIDSYKCHRR